MKYDLRRWRFREATFEGDEGPEGGRFRYDISLGLFDQIKDCYDMVARIEGVSVDDVEFDIEHHGRYTTELRPLGCLSLYEYHKIDGSYIGKIPATYWDEYTVYGIQ